MPSAPTFSSPADYANPASPFDIVGTADAGSLVEARDDAGLLLPATANPVVATGGNYTIAVTSRTGDKGAVYVASSGQVTVAANPNLLLTANGGADADGYPANGAPWVFQQTPTLTGGQTDNNGGTSALEIAGNVTSANCGFYNAGAGRAISPSTQYTLGAELKLVANQGAMALKVFNQAFSLIQSGSNWRTSCNVSTFTTVSLSFTTGPSDTAVFLSFLFDGGGAGTYDIIVGRVGLWLGSSVGSW